MGSLLRLFVAASLILGMGRADASPPSPEVEDVLLTIQVRRVLYEDDELRPFNLGVRVVDRVATLFGPAPTLDVGLRAESRLRGLIELRDVRNHLDVPPPPEK